MTFLKVFLICTFKDPNLVEKLTNLAENLLKVELHRVHRVSFFPVCFVVYFLIFLQFGPRAQKYVWPAVGDFFFFLSFSNNQTTLFKKKHFLKRRAYV